MTARSIPRIEDLRFLTGRGDYVADRTAPGLLEGVVLRSPHAHARLGTIAAEAARRLPGVHLVLTGEMLDALGPLPCITALDTVGPFVKPSRPVLARGTVRHVGDPVAFVVAETRTQALDAAEAIEVAYDPLPPVTDLAAAVAPDAPQLWPEAPGNTSFVFHRGDAAAVQAAMGTAAHVIEAELVNNRVVIAPLEARAAIGDWQGEDATLVLTGQAVHGVRQQIAGRILGIPNERLRLIVPDVGGGFGVKNFVYPEWVLVLEAARRIGRPVRWVSERIEDFHSSTQGRDNRTKLRLALDAGHNILAFEARVLSNMGAYLSTNGPLAPTTAFASAMGGVYAIPAIDIEVRGVFTNTVPIDAYRGAGKPEANYIIERMIDIAAARLGVDPVELRHRNMMRNAPRRSATGMQIDGGRFGLNLEDALRRADHAGFPARRAASERAGLLRGLGFGCFLETARGAPNEVASIRMEPDGSIVFAVGTQSNGQGHETSYAQVAASMLGLPLDRFRFRQGDTVLLPGGGGHGGARSLQLGGTALVLAVEAMVAKGCSVAAHLLQARREDIAFRGGAFHHRLDGRALPLDDIAAASRDPANLPDGLTPGLDGMGQNISDLYAFPNGCHVAEVEIDPETGSVRLCRYTLVDDYGTLVNPRLTLGQVQGGVAQGIGQAMLEHAAYDAVTGQFLAGSLMDYALPRASDLPDFDAVLAEDVPTASNRLGVKGAGQAGCMAAPQAVMNAIMDALSAVGVRHLDMPATPLRVWQAIEAAGRGKAGPAG